ncbi:hypothetical protein ACOMHN_062902 [Nucella lapillus]
MGAPSAEKPDMRSCQKETAAQPVGKMRRDAENRYRSFPDRSFRPYPLRFSMAAPSAEKPDMRDKTSRAVLNALEFGQ